MDRLAIDNMKWEFLSIRWHWHRHHGSSAYSLTFIQSPYRVWWNRRIVHYLVRHSYHLYHPSVKSFEFRKLCASSVGCSVVLVMDTEAVSCFMYSCLVQRLGFSFFAKAMMSCNQSDSLRCSSRWRYIALLTLLLVPWGPVLKVCFVIC